MLAGGLFLPEFGEGLGQGLAGGRGDVGNETESFAGDFIDGGTGGGIAIVERWVTGQVLAVDGGLSSLQARTQ